MSEHDSLQVGSRPCRMFEDPENAIAVNEGATLIPWMGDRSNMIDRYDVRGHLYSEADFGLKTGVEEEDEEEDEDYIDKERYLFLSVDELEFEAYLEEEEKRFNSKKTKASGGAYLQVAFSYGDESESSSPARVSIEDEVYVPVRELLVPDNMPVPSTTKHYKIMEKTAVFMSTQNMQMELILRTKQKNSPQFQFLEPDHELNKFYKHLVSAIKDGTYKVALPPKPLPAPKPVKEPIPPQVIAAGPLPLTNQGQWGGLAMSLHTENKKGEKSGLAALSAYGAASDDDSSDDEVIMHSAVTNMFQSMGAPIPVPPGTDPAMIQYLIMYRGFVALPPPAPGLPPLLVPPNGQEGFLLPLQPPPPPPEEEVLVSTVDEDDSPDSESRPTSPSPDQKIIIKKLAEYVVKNGDSFEKKVLEKRDQRFRFVHPDDEDHPYYQYLIQKFRNRRISLNVKPIKLKSTHKPSSLPPVDDTVFNQSSEEENEEEEEENEKDSESESEPDVPEGQDNVDNSSPSPSPDPENEDVVSDGIPMEDLPEATSPHPLDSDNESDEEDVQTMVTSPKERRSLTPSASVTSPSHSHTSQVTSPKDRRSLTPLAYTSPAKTPVYTASRDVTPSPARTPKMSGGETPIRSPMESPPPSPPGSSDDSSSESETEETPRGQVEHFDTEDESEKEEDERSVTREESEESSRHSSPEKSRSPTPEKKRDSSVEKKKLRQISVEKKRLIKEEKVKKEKVRKEKAREKVKTPEVKEEGELSEPERRRRRRKSDSREEKKRKHKKKEKRSTDFHKKHPKKEAKTKKNKKTRSRKRDVSTDSEDEKVSKRLKSADSRKRKRTGSPSSKPRKLTDEWMSEKMKKLSKIELLKEIEDKLEAKRKLKESARTSVDKDDEKRLAMEKELKDIEARLQAKKLKKKEEENKMKSDKNSSNGRISKKSSPESKCPNEKIKCAKKEDAKSLDKNIPKDKENVDSKKDHGNGKEELKPKKEKLKKSKDSDTELRHNSKHRNGLDTPERSKKVKKVSKDTKEVKESNKSKHRK